MDNFYFINQQYNKIMKTSQKRSRSNSPPRLTIDRSSSSDSLGEIADLPIVKKGEYNDVSHKRQRPQNPHTGALGEIMEIGQVNTGVESLEGLLGLMGISGIRRDPDSGLNRRPVSPSRYNKKGGKSAKSKTRCKRNNGYKNSKKGKKHVTKNSLRGSTMRISKKYRKKTRKCVKKGIKS